MKNQSSTVSIYMFLALLLATSGCGRLFPKQTASPYLIELAKKMVDYCWSEEKGTADITDTLLEFKTLADDVYQGKTTPQKSDYNYDEWNYGLALESYPESGNASATVGLPLEASMDEILSIVLHDDYSQVLLDPMRYYVYERTFAQGSREEFLSGAIDYVVTRNYQEDVGQQGVSFKYDTDMTFRRFSKSLNASMPEKGAVVVCNKMDGEAVNNDLYNAYMTSLYSFTIWYPIDATHTYRINGTWIKAGGGLGFINLSANSGNVAKGILDETSSIMNCVDSASCP